MTRTEICKKNYKKLFREEALKTTGDDPEMMLILQKYIFGEIFTIGDLDFKTRELITITILTVQQTLPQLKAHINAALNIDVKPIEIRETIYQCAPFIGFPKTLNALNSFNEILKENNIKTPLENTSTVKEQERYKKGYLLQNKIYGEEIKNSIKDIANGEKVAKLLTEVCFGDFHTRKGLDIKTRELLIIPILVSNGEIAILKSHIKGNLAVGNNQETIIATIIQCLPYVGFPKALTALTMTKEFCK